MNCMEAYLNSRIEKTPENWKNWAIAWEMAKARPRIVFNFFSDMIEKEQYIYFDVETMNKLKEYLEM